MTEGKQLYTINQYVGCQARDLEIPGLLLVAKAVRIRSQRLDLSAIFGSRIGFFWFRVKRG